MNVHHTATDCITLHSVPSLVAFVVKDRKVLDFDEFCEALTLEQAAQMAKDILDVLLKDNEELAEDILWHGEVHFINKEIECTE